MNKSLILGIFLLFSCSWLKKDQTLRIGLESEISTLDPAKAFDDSSLKAINQTYETLYEYHYLQRPYRLMPLLAQDFPQKDASQTIYTIKIKPSIPYHSDPSLKEKNRKVVAQDFVNSIKRLAFRPINSSGQWLFQGKLKGFDEFAKKVQDDENLFYQESISGVKTPDPLTLVLEFNQPVPELLYLLAMSFIVPLPEEVLKYYHNDLSRHMVGTGPFFFNGFTRQEGKETLLLQNFSSYRGTLYPSTGDRYANEKALLNRGTQKINPPHAIQFISLADEDERWSFFLKNKIDVMEIPKQYINEAIDLTGQLKSSYAQKNIHLQFFPSHSSRWLAFNMNDPVVGKNKKLREAIAYAINYDNYLQMVTDKTGQRANSIYMPGIFGYDPAKKSRFYYNREMALQMLKEAGYPEGKGLNLVYTTRGNSQKSLMEANFIQRSLEYVGIKIKIQEVDWKTFGSLTKKGQVQFWTDGWILDYPDARNILQLLISKNTPPGVNKTAYTNKQVDILYEKISQTTDENKSAVLMAQIEKLVDEDVPWIMLYYNHTYILYHSYVKNFRQSNFVRNFLKYIEIDK